MGNLLSYWEQKMYFSNVDFTVVGAGIVGLHCALKLRTEFPKSSIVVLERGLLPQGASTKNAGFACFGSVSELLDDLNTHTESQVLELVEKRYKGLRQLKATLGSQQIGYKHHKGFELFLKDAPEIYRRCMDKFAEINKLLYPIFNKEVFTTQKNNFSFKGVFDNYLVNDFEGQLDTGKMMHALYRKCVQNDITILYGLHVNGYELKGGDVLIKTALLDFRSTKLCIATNGLYDGPAVDQQNVKPARAQVLITKPIPNLHLKGTFHLDRGFYYFRNIDNRILLGGGRNLDMQTEQTTVFDTTKVIQDKLDQLLRNVILPNTEVEVDSRWSGIMGVGNSKHPIVKKIADNVFCGVRLGGMGIAIGSQVGEDLANLTMKYV
ncbi:NAD(P)/FAD-dependent oxidoreductase [Galbibacter sp.]|jgi:glycine/D-amino acid oxidase-like deaminating enzyme|uniref:NAD(P)/FAD-dependent oxidoreductase n=1 Tax=Galbibacter sp. TaxID=2918471 RepID=UPI003A94AE82